MKRRWQTITRKRLQPGDLRAYRSARKPLSPRSTVHAIAFLRWLVHETYDLPQWTTSCTRLARERNLPAPMNETAQTTRPSESTLRNSVPRLPGGNRSKRPELDFLGESNWLLGFRRPRRGRKVAACPWRHAGHLNNRRVFGELLA